MAPRKTFDLQKVSLMKSVLATLTPKQQEVFNSQEAVTELMSGIRKALRFGYSMDDIAHILKTQTGAEFNPKTLSVIYKNLTQKTSKKKSAGAPAKCEQNSGRSNPKSTPDIEGKEERLVRDVAKNFCAPIAQNDGKEAKIKDNKDAALATIFRQETPR